MAEGLIGRCLSFFPKWRLKCVFHYTGATSDKNRLMSIMIVLSLKILVKFTYLVGIKTFMTYVLWVFFLRLLLQPTASSRSLSWPNIRLQPKVKIEPTVQHWTLSSTYMVFKKLTLHIFIYAKPTTRILNSIY